MELTERLEKLSYRLEKEGRYVDAIIATQAAYTIKELEKFKEGVTKVVENNV